MTNSKDKGKRGELEWCKVCKEHGYNVRRTVQYCGNTGEAADCVGLPGIHQEVKRVERLDIHKAMEQAQNDAGKEGKDNIPIVAHRKNGTGWLVTMRAEDWFRLYDCARWYEDFDLYDVPVWYPGKDMEE